MAEQAITKQRGITAAERYVASLCERTFLSLWSYPNVYRDEFIPGTHIGKEVCDLLVVFGKHVIIFSDKDCAVGDTGNLALDWSRWFRRAVVKNAKQLHGAQRWIREAPERLFLDASCTRQLPVLPRTPDGARVHLVVVAHNITARCQEVLGGSGSLMIQNDLRGIGAHNLPFTVGDLDPARSFVHVLDDTTLPVLLEELDTIEDFVAYLDKKVAFLRGPHFVHATGEEELLTGYLRGRNNAGEHDFVVPEGFAAIGFGEGGYFDYLRSAERRAKAEADRVSYAWDRLIEKFSFHAMRGTQHRLATGGVSVTERILRVMAAESRTRRRVLARKLVECVETTPSHIRRLAVVPPFAPESPYYCFLMIPWDNEATKDENRDFRMWFLKECCGVVRLMFPDASTVLGVATQSGQDDLSRSEDAVLGDFHDWTEEEAAHAREFQARTGVLTNAKRSTIAEREYPVAVPRLSGSARNGPCPCGSGKKYKKCHGAPRGSIPSTSSAGGD